MISILTKTLSTARSSYWISSGWYTFLSKGFTVFFGLANFVILIRLLSREDYGAWVLFISVSTLMELIKHGFIRNPLVRFLSITSEKEWGGLQTASLFLNFLIGLIQSALLILMAYVLSSFWAVPQLKQLFFIYIFTTLALVPANHFEVVQQAGMQFKEIFIAHCIRQGGLFLFVMLAFLFDWTIDLYRLAIVQCVSVVLSCIVSFILSGKLLQFSARVEKKWIGELFHYGKFTFGTNVSSMIIKNIDSWMLGRLISVEAVTIFNPAIRMSNLGEVPNDTLSFIYFPRVSKNIVTEGEASVKRFYEKAVGAILAMMIPVTLMVILLANSVIDLVAGSGFEESVPILQITMIYGLLIPFNRFFGITLDAIGMADINFRTVLLMAAINIVSNLFFISWLGTIGAAYGTLFTYIISVLYTQSILYRKFGITVTSVMAYALGYYARVWDWLKER